MRYSNDIFLLFLWHILIIHMAYSYDIFLHKSYKHQTKTDKNHTKKHTNITQKSNYICKLKGTCRTSNLSTSKSTPIVAL